MMRSCSAWMVPTMSDIRPGALGVQRGQQRAFALQRRAVGEHGRIQHVVFDAP